MAMANTLAYKYYFNGKKTWNLYSNGIFSSKPYLITREYKKHIFVNF
jgi:hypothetical protein